MTKFLHAAPKVTVAVPVYNSAETLRRCIRSAASQTLQNIEIIIADDGSTDDSAAIAEAMALDDRRIRVIRLPTNGGKPKAMNVISAVARGEWIAVLDADDAYSPERLDRLVLQAEGRDVDMIADNLLYVDGGVGRVVRTAFDTASAPRVLGLDDLVRTANVYGAFDMGILKPMIRRDFIERTGISYYEHARLAEDFYYLLSFFAAGGRALLVSAPLYLWTLPFGTLSRKWTKTGAGPWRYDYRSALLANEHFEREMRIRGIANAVEMLAIRSRQYRTMISYLDAQRWASEGRWLKCFGGIVSNPSTYRLLAVRVSGRAWRAVVGTMGRFAPKQAGGGA